jgi:hypothetical protein
MFDPIALRGVIRHLVAVEPLLQEVEQYPTDSGRRAIGAGTVALRFEREWFDIWRAIGDDIVAWLSPFTMLMFPPQVRHVKEVNHLVPWHQDIGYQRLLHSRQHQRLITCFVPLELEPERAPGLEFALGDFAEFRHSPDGLHGAAIEIADADLDIATFSLRFGDALIFGDLAPHRTYVPPGAALSRRSFEFRLVRPDDALDGRDYFDISRRCFTRTDGSTREFP